MASSSSRSVPELFHEALRADAQIRAGDPVVALVSGGSDSVALLHLLARVGDALRARVHVLHFNHGTRPECAAEESFVQGLAEGYGLPFHARRLAAVPATGLQAKTRAWRRAEAEALVATLAEGPEGRGDGRGHIALGHHADDDVETLLLKLLRGVHLSRAAGMSVREGPYIRPLLRVPKAALTGWLEGEGLPWMEDSSNREGGYKRNRVRRDLVPLLEELTGGALHARLADLTAQSAQLRALVESEAAPLVRAVRLEGSLSVEALLAAPAAVRAEAVHALVTQATGAATSFAEVERVLRQVETADGPRWRLSLSGGRTVRRAGDRLAAEGPAPAASAPDFSDWPRVQRGGITVVHHPRWAVEMLGPGEEARAPCTALHNLPPGTRLLLRPWAPGDLIQLPGRPRPARLAKHLRGQGLAVHERDATPVVTALQPQGTAGDGAAPRESDGPVLAALPGRVGEPWREPGRVAEGAGAQSVCLRVSDAEPPPT